MTDIDALIALGDELPSGPWGWFGQAGHSLYLATNHSGRQYLMCFDRMGMRGAQPTFRVGSALKPALDLLRFEVGDRNILGYKAAKADPSVYRYDISDVDNPVARAIAAVPDFIAALTRLRDENVRLRGALEDALAILMRGGKASQSECNRFRAALTAPSAGRETSWLIERTLDGKLRYYWEPIPFTHGWTTNVQNAKRFATKLEAETEIGSATGLSAREHIWMAASEQQGNEGGV